MAADPSVQLSRTRELDRRLRDRWRDAECGRHSDEKLFRSRILCGHPLTGCTDSLIWPAAAQALPRARPPLLPTCITMRRQSPAELPGAAKSASHRREESCLDASLSTRHSVVVKMRLTVVRDEARTRPRGSAVSVVRVGTWNVEYARGAEKNDRRRAQLLSRRAAVWVLTETHDDLDLSATHDAVRSEHPHGVVRGRQVE